jgi:hypothetical protein
MKQKAKKYINSIYIDYGDLNYKAEEQIKQAFIDGMSQQLILSGVSQQRELLDLLTEIANSDTLYSNTRHRMIARKLLKSNCG